MSIGTARKVAPAIVVAITAIAVLVAGGVSAAAPVSHAGKAGDAKIRMFVKGKNLGFKGTRKVSAGAELSIVNRTDPQLVGPHTFTLIRKRKLPSTGKQMKRCEQGKGVCAAIARAHRYDPQTNIVHRPDVDVGKAGWDRSFGKRGDSWYTETDGERTSRVVSAKPGTTLYYFCVVHPFMQGKIKVVK